MSTASLPNCHPLLRQMTSAKYCRLAMVKSFEKLWQIGLGQTDACLFPIDFLAVYQYQKVLCPKASARLETDSTALVRTKPSYCVPICCCQQLGSPVSFETLSGNHAMHFAFSSHAHTPCGCRSLSPTRCSRCASLMLRLLGNIAADTLE